MEEIKIYTTPTCPYCKIAKEYMKGKGVDFKEYNVAQDHEALQKRACVRLRTPSFP